MCNFPRQWTCPSKHWCQVEQTQILKVKNVLKQYPRIVVFPTLKNYQGAPYYALRIKFLIETALFEIISNTF